jgi:hypothetical protein
VIDFTTVVAVDEQHVPELLAVWPTWAQFRPEILQYPFLLICDANLGDTQIAALTSHLNHPQLRAEKWEMPHVPQREKMLSGLVYIPARHVETPWYLKLDTDTIALKPAQWIQENWFQPDERGRDPVFIGHSWGYTKPPDAIQRLDDWADTVSELRQYPRLNLVPNPGWSLVRCRRVTSWLLFGRTDWTREMAAYSPDRLPVPSQDTYLWYCAARRGDFYRRESMIRRGWIHIRDLSRLKDLATEALKQASAKSSCIITGASERTAELDDAPLGAAKLPRHATELTRILQGLQSKRVRGAEIGVAQGHASQVLLNSFPQLFLYMVDTWSAFFGPSEYRQSGDSAARLSQARHDANRQSAEALTAFAQDRRQLLAMDSVSAASQVEDASLDFAFIDADHTYKAVASDIATWWPKVRPGGLMCGHDYEHPRDRRGLWGVKRAVHEFAEAHSLHVAVHGSTIWSLVKPAEGELAPANSEQVLPSPSEPCQECQDKLPRRLERSDHKGVVYLLTGPSHAVRVVVSLWSLRKHFDGPITLYTTHPRSYEIGERCKADSRLRVDHRPFHDVATRRNSAFLTKVALLPHVPYDIAAYFDADTLVTGDIGELMDVRPEDEFHATQFSNWQTGGRIVSDRIKQWREIQQDRYDRAYFDSLIDAALQPQPAVNGGVFAVHRGASILRPWFELAMIGKDTFICDEIALQLLLPHYPHRLLDCRYNCSPLHGVNKHDARVWHFHGEKHVNRKAARDLWLPTYLECLQHDIAEMREWTPAGDRRLAAFLRNVDEVPL